MTATAARQVAIRVVSRRLRGQGVSAQVSTGDAPDLVDIRVDHAYRAAVIGAIETSGTSLSVWTWISGKAQPAEVSGMLAGDVGLHPGYRPVPAGIDDTMIVSVQARARGFNEQPDVVIILDEQGAAALDRVSRYLAAQPFSSVDNKIVVVIAGSIFEEANVLQEISGGSMVVFGGRPSWSLPYAQQLADQLNRGTLPVGLTRLEA